jgi:predicted nucleic-acid-binding protein
MIAVDTNVVVRLIIDDDPAQTERAAELLRSGAILITRTVLLETVWVLRDTYELDRGRVAAVIRRLLGLDGVAVDDWNVVRRALGWFETGLDFADALHLASAGTGATEFVTFDRRFARRAVRLGAEPSVRSL